MKAVLEFNLPEETIDFRHALHGSEYMDLISSYTNLIRGAIKYSSESEEFVRGLQYCFDKFFSMCNEHEINAWGD